MTIGTKDLKVTELDTFEDTRLSDELKKAKEELFNLRFQSATGTLEGHGRLRAVKRDIARIYTVLRERELGIRITPEPAAVTAAAPKKTRSRRAAADAAPAADSVPATDSVSATDTESAVDIEQPAAEAGTERTTEESN